MYGVSVWCEYIVHVCGSEDNAWELAFSLHLGPWGLNSVCQICGTSTFLTEQSLWLLFTSEHPGGSCVNVYFVRNRPLSGCQFWSGYQHNKNEKI